jgi:N-acyl-D-amino-acid deacylase
MAKINRRNFIKLTSLAGTFSAVPVLSFQKNIFLNDRRFDLIIKNGSIIDGTGKKEFISDLGIKSGKIVYIGSINPDEGIKVINANGLKVAPGFIDIHSHTDINLILNPKAESKIRQGITTEICGQDGSSLAPVPSSSSGLKDFKDEYGTELNWNTMQEFLNDFSSRKFAVNLASMLGLGTIREFVVGLDDRPATTDELNLMREEVRKAVDGGAIGLSTGLEYTPGSFASTEELIELCKAASIKKRIYSTHMRNEDVSVLEAIDEAIKIARESDSRLLISHLKVSGKSNWYKVDEALSMIDNAADKGLEIHADRYTYVAYHTTLANLFPQTSRDGGTKKFLERLNDSSLLKEFNLFTQKKVSDLDGEYSGILISSVGKKELKEKYQGKTIQKISEEKGKDPFSTIVDIIIETENRAMMVGFGMEESSTEKILAHPRVMIASDAGAHAPYPPMNKSIAHPRAYGTFPRAIAKYVRERKICTLEEMIKKMTLMPAEKLKLFERGKIEEGYFADLVIFDFNKIRDRATFTDPHNYPEGIPFVIVNGKVVIDNGEHTGDLPGIVLK